MADVYDEAGLELNRDPFYVHPQALEELPESARLSENEIGEFSARLRAASVATYVAVLPMEAQTGRGATQLAEVANRSGVFLAILSDGRYDATATSNASLTAAEAREAARAARSASGGGLREFVTGFIDEVEAAAAGPAEPAEPAAGEPGDGGSSGLLTLGLLAAFGAGGFVLMRRNRRAREQAQLAEVSRVVDEDITAYGEELVALDMDVQLTDEANGADYAAALEHYERAKAALAAAERPADVEAVTHHLEEGRWVLARVRARLAGEPLPERRPPCFFDPRHGPSVEDVEWAPRGGQPRSVPACAADATRIKDGLDPEARLVPVGGGQRPYWEAGPAYGPWAGGYFGMALPAMLWGTMLGSMWGGSPLHTDPGGLQAGEGFDGGGFDGWSGGGGFDGGGFDGGGGWEWPRTASSAAQSRVCSRRAASAIDPDSDG